MDKRTINDLLLYGEHIHMECKEAKRELPKSVWETYSSFANTDGGIILLGIAENSREADYHKRFVVSGISDPDKMVNDFWNTINSNKVSANIMKDENVEICKFERKSIICIQVPPANYLQKPIFINENPFKGSFKRNHEGDYHCTAGEVKAMIRDASDDGIDGGLLTGYTMADIDIDTLKSYRLEYENKNPEHVWNSLNHQDFLRCLGGYTIDRTAKKEGLTTAGLLMFGKGLPIRDRFDNVRFDYVDKTNLIGDQRWSDRLTYDGTWENNLYNFYRLVIPKLTFDLKRPFKLEGMSRVDDTPVHRAVREAFINLIIHSDYMITGVLKIEKLDRGFLFSNPGSLKLSVTDIYKGGNSKARNPRIQTMLRLIGLGDNIGSGFPTILNAWQEESWRKPDLSDKPDLHQVDLHLWMISLMPRESTEYLQRLFGSQYNQLSSTEQIILTTAYVEGTLSNNRLQPLLDMHAVDIGRILSGLVDKSMLILDYKGRWTTYTLNCEYQQQELSDLRDGREPDIKLNKTDQLIYEYIKEKGFITSQQIIENTKINSMSGANAALTRLRRAGIIEKVRRRNQVYYKLMSENQ